jgi:hypothetical protein
MARAKYFLSREYLKNNYRLENRGEVLKQSVSRDHGDDTQLSGPTAMLRSGTRLPGFIIN